MTSRRNSDRAWRIGLAALLVGSALLGAVIGGPAAHASFLFSTGAPDGRMAMASRPVSGSLLETEAADDFILPSTTSITQATFTGLLPSGDPLSDVQQVIVEIYRVFPLDSNVGRTSGAPVFSTSQVPTRVNSPSDVEFLGADSSAGGLTFSTSVVAGTFTATNSVNLGINPKPNQTTGGEGPVTGEEVQFNVTFTPPLSLPADHYFFVPQVKLGSTHVFYWLSAPRPLFTGDLQAWIRNSALDPDWLRVGTDIVGGATPPTFNASFSLTDAPSSTVVTGNQPGNLKPPAGGAVDVESATVTGNVKISGAASVRICNSTIGGNLDVSGTTGSVVIGDGASCLGNHVSGGVTLSNNTGGVTVAGNHIGGNLGCTGNSPAPTNNSSPNTVGGSRSGQCGAPGF